MIGSVEVKTLVFRPFVPVVDAQRVLASCKFFPAGITGIEEIPSRHPGVPTLGRADDRLDILVVCIAIHLTVFTFYQL